jgi:hypothetical protein
MMRVGWYRKAYETVAKPQNTTAEALVRGQHPGGVDKCDMRQGLRKVSHESTVIRIILLGQ